jgi:hypothetical protein
MTLTLRGKVRLNALREILRRNVDDERFRQLFSDFARLIHTSVKLCEDLPFPEDAEEINNYIEELLGLSFVLLQAQIRRVSEAAAKFVLLRAEIRRGSEAAVKFVLLQAKIQQEAAEFRALGDPYKDTGKRLAELIWALGNYYKHNDTWGSEEWSDDALDPKVFSKSLRNNIEQARKTRRIVEQVGIVRGLSAGNMRTPYEFFGVDWASDCTPLADKVQEWAKAVYEKCANP